MRVLRPARRIHIRRRGRVLRNSPPPASVRSATDPNRGRAWHPREFGAVLGVSASLPLPAPPLPSSSRRDAPQCFVGGYTSSPCDVSHRASDEPRRRMSLSSALAPSSLASPSIWRVFLRSLCARRRPVSSLNLVRATSAAWSRQDLITTVAGVCDILFGMRRCRINLPDRCYHLISRVAHRAFEGGKLRIERVAPL